MFTNNKNLQKKVAETVTATAAAVAGVAVTNNVHADTVNNNNAQTQTVQDVRKQAIKNAEQGVKSAQANLDSALLQIATHKLT